MTSCNGGASGGVTSAARSACEVSGGFESCVVSPRLTSGAIVSPCLSSAGIVSDD
jgi:hypothetical protein